MHGPNPMMHFARKLMLLAVKIGLINGYWLRVMHSQCDVQKPMRVIFAPQGCACALRRSEIRGRVRFSGLWMDFFSHSLHVRVIIGRWLAVKPGIFDLPKNCLRSVSHFHPNISPRLRKWNKIGAQYQEIVIFSPSRNTIHELVVAMWAWEGEICTNWTITISDNGGPRARLFFAQSELLFTLEHHIRILPPFIQDTSTFIQLLVTMAETTYKMPFI